jgi:hypothetical protein
MTLCGRTLSTRAWQGGMAGHTHQWHCEAYSLFLLSLPLLYSDFFNYHAALSPGLYLGRPAWLHFSFACPLVLVLVSGRPCMAYAMPLHPLLHVSLSLTCLDLSSLHPIPKRDSTPPAHLHRAALPLAKPYPSSLSLPPGGHQEADSSDETTPAH